MITCCQVRKLQTDCCVQCVAMRPHWNAWLHVTASTKRHARVLRSEGICLRKRCFDRLRLLRHQRPDARGLHGYAELQVLLDAWTRRHQRLMLRNWHKLRLRHPRESIGVRKEPRNCIIHAQRGWFVSDGTCRRNRRAALGQRSLGIAQVARTNASGITLDFDLHFRHHGESRTRELSTRGRVPVPVAFTTQGPCCRESLVSKNCTPFGSGFLLMPLTTQ